MRSDAKRYLIYALAAFVMITVIGIAFLWTMDNVLSGTVVDFLNTLISGVDTATGEVRFQREMLATTGLFVVILFAALLSGGCALCAYRAYRGQHTQLEKALLDGEKAQNLAEREMQRKSDLITYLAHDLKTPLASVIAYLNLLIESPEITPEQRAKYTGIALDKAYRLEQLIGELFEIIRFNLQTISVNREKINLKLMLMQLADEFYAILLPDGKSIRVECEDGCILYGDSDKLARVFNNILRNAAAYSYENTVITVSVAHTAASTQIVFANVGDPIPEQKRSLIFEKFYRLDTSRSTQTGGAGLGLAIAKEIVDAHHGQISVESDSSGTRFLVTLPTI